MNKVDLGQTITILANVGTQSISVLAVATLLTPTVQAAGLRSLGDLPEGCNSGITTDVSADGSVVVGELPYRGIPVDI